MNDLDKREAELKEELQAIKREQIKQHLLDHIQNNSPSSRRFPWSDLQAIAQKYDVSTGKVWGVLKDNFSECDNVLRNDYRAMWSNCRGHRYSFKFWCERRLSEEDVKLEIQRFLTEHGPQLAGTISKHIDNWGHYQGYATGTHDSFPWIFNTLMHLTNTRHRKDTPPWVQIYDAETGREGCHWPECVWALKEHVPTPPIPKLTIYGIVGIVVIEHESSDDS